MTPPPGIIEALDALLADLALTRAAEALRLIIRELDGTTAAVALNRVVLGDDGESYQDAADRRGVSKVAVFKAEQRIRERLTMGAKSNV